jgi:branched-chain amino acid transport system substrate-binding protein
MEERMNKRFFVFVALILVMVIASCSPSAGSNPSDAGAAPAECASDAFGCAKIAPGQTIKIGMGAPMTGGDASFGIDISQGGRIAVTDAGELEGFKFELIAEDDSGTAEGGAAVANKLVADPTVVAIAGHIFSGATAAAIPIYEKVGLPMLSPSATNPPLAEMGSKVFNRIAFTDAIQGKFAGTYLYEKLGIRKLAVMHDGSDYGKGLAEIVRDTFTSLGGEVVSFSAITSKESDYTAPLAAVAATQPEALYFGGYTQDGAILANNMKQTGLENAIFFGCDGTYGQDFLDRTGANGNGAYAVSLTPADTDSKVKFDAAYEAAFGVKPGTLSPYTWNGYDVVAALIAQVKAVAIKGSDGNLYIPRGALVNAVRNLKDYQGLTGVFTCDAKGECNASGPLLVTIQDGKWVVAE